MSDRSLPPPLVPPDIDVGDMPLPRDFFIEMAVAQFGVDRAEATKFVNERADAIEQERRKGSRPC